MKKVICLTLEELLDLFTKHFDCNSELYLDVENIEGEEIFFDYIKLNPSKENFNKIAVKLCDTFNIDEMQIISSKDKSILVDLNIASTLIDKKFNVKTTGWYDIDYSESLDKTQEVVLFEVE